MAERTYKSIAKECVINGVKYEIEEYHTWYNPYGKAEEDVVITKKVTHYSFGYSVDYLDQYKNKWYPNSSFKCCLYIDGVLATPLPISSYSVEDLIKEHSNLDETKTPLWKLLKDVQPKDFETYNGTYIPNYNEMFTPKYKIGDRVFYVEHRGSDTRCGERLQIFDFIIQHINISNGDILYYSNKNVNYYTTICCRENECCLSVEELCAKYPNETLYMWHHNGRVAIEPCKSTSYYLAYNG